MKLLRYILFPIVPIYFLVTWLRNKLYDIGWKTSMSFKTPVICVGNLSVGGTGKTPMIEYLIKLLSKNYAVATLSRGYKRQSSGFVIADENASVSSIGDEPYQFYNKFDDIIVAVDADRRHGIRELIKQKQPDVILLDDAYQHRKVKAGFNILLSSYDKLYINDIVLPTGDLREPRSGAKRADIIVVTKCPNSIDAKERLKIENQLKLLPHQNLFFSSITYSEAVFSDTNQESLSSFKSTDFTLVTGIANPKPLVDFLNKNEYKFEHLKFKDHHNFSEDEINELKLKRKIITTEKDYMRLRPNFKNEGQLFYLPIEIQISSPELFENLVNRYLKS